MVFSFIQHNDGFLHILRVRAIRCENATTCIVEAVMQMNKRQPCPSIRATSVRQWRHQL